PHVSAFYLYILPRPHISPLFPYTTLFRSVEAREKAVHRLTKGELQYIITVDIFNEGVDIPILNQIVMMRPTKSNIIFLQQLGRGDRKSTRLNSSHVSISYAVFCLKKKKTV